MASLESFMNKFGADGTPQEWNSAFELEQPSPKAAGLESFINRFTGMTDESFWFYDNTIQLKFSVEDHVYYLVDPILGNLIEVNGVTNTVHIINASEMLIPWAAKMTVAKLLRLMPTETVEGVLRVKAITFEEFTTIALEAKSAHKDKLEEAGDIGHLAHKCLEDSIRYAIENDPEKIVRDLVMLPLDELAANAARGAKSWMDQHNVRWLETETKIYSKQYQYAGTMDGLATCDSCQDKSCCPEQFKDRLSLIDWKSSNHLKIEYLFQTASYQYAKQEEKGLQIVDRWILRLGKNEDEAGKFEPWHMGPSDFSEDFEGFLACLRLTRLVDSVNERMKAQKKTIRSVKKEMRETAKALAKEQAKLAKALEKAEAKRLKEIEKEKTKAEAKAAREAAKKGKACTSTSSPNEASIQLDSILPTKSSSQNQTTETNTVQPSACTTSTEETAAYATSPNQVSVPIKAVDHRSLAGFSFEEQSVQYKPLALPQEK